MKKFFIIASAVIIGLYLFDYLYYYAGVLYIPRTGSAEYFAKTEDKNFYIDHGDGFEKFEIRGVNMGLGKPGHYATEMAITKEEYLRWFQQIKELGANVIRVYTLGGENFYEAFYEFNVDNPDPLYLIHGVWVDDYLINSVYSALDKEFYEPFIEDCKAIVDAIHGRHKINAEDKLMPSFYCWDISPWVIGYILGIEWEDTLVVYTDRSFEQLPQFEGTYFYTENASNFEIFLANIGETVVKYETQKYGTQRLVAFSNWATTDPFEYPDVVANYFKKIAKIDVEHIKCTDKLLSGHFASYHIYPYYPDYYSFFPDHEENTYSQYLTEIISHHTIPVVISEFGVSSARGMAAYDGHGRNQGGISETQQGQALVSMYQDIKEAGSAGAIVFTWQDEWFKRTWNTMSNTDLLSTPYWSDYQTNEQYFGLLSFDPGETESVCYVDGNRSDWFAEDLVIDHDNIRLSVKYDEKFIYFLVEQSDFSISHDCLYISIDTTPKSGSRYAENFGIEMSEDADFIVEINGEYNSRIWVQERYDSIDSLYYDKITKDNIFSKTFPESDSTKFNQIFMLIQKNLYFRKLSAEADPSTDELIPFQDYDSMSSLYYQIMETYETGKLTYGNANPNGEDFNSLADFCAGVGFVEVKIPWALLNFADPSHMKIHDDYYECYGVEYLRVNSMMVGAGDGSALINMAPVELEPLGKKPTYHERLKESYYILKAEWTKTN